MAPDDVLEYRVAQLETLMHAAARERRELRRMIEEMAKADEIAAAVAAQLEGQARVKLTRWQKAGAFLGAVFVVISSLKGAHVPLSLHVLSPSAWFDAMRNG